MLFLMSVLAESPETEFQYLAVVLTLFLMWVCVWGGGADSVPGGFSIAVPKPFGVRIGNFWTLLRIDSLTL